MSSAPAKLTVLFLLYNAQTAVRRLVDHLLEQRWDPSLSVEAWFVDDGSKDQTLLELNRALADHKRAQPERDFDWIRIRPNPRNLGLAGSLNHSLKQVDSPYVLTCHLDCYFQSPRYLEGMVNLMEQNPKVVAITGKPSLDPASSLTLAQKLNAVINLMDVLPTSSASPEITPVGFAEGRCDIFRMSALREIGFYPDSLRTSGEDQILASRLRARGGSIAQALRLNYVLSTSSEQDTLPRLARHLVLFGQTQFQVLATTRGSLQGAATQDSGKNRGLRMQMRLLQLTHSALIGLIPTAFLFFHSSNFSSALLALWAVVQFRKVQLWCSQTRVVELTGFEWIALFLLQFYFDLAYALGVLLGFTQWIGKKLHD